MKNFFNKIRQISKNINIVRPLTRKKIGLWKWDIQTNKFFINDFWLEKLGYKNTKIHTMEYWMSNVHPDDRDRIQKKLTDYIVDGGIKKKTVDVANEWYTDDNGDIDMEKFNFMMDTQQSILNLKEDNNSFKKELASITT